MISGRAPVQNGAAHAIATLLKSCRSLDNAVVILSAGKSFLAMPSASFAPDVGQELTSFWTNLTQHLAELKLWLGTKEVECQRLGSLGMLTALQKLELYGPCTLCGPFGEAYALKLPHLVSLYLTSFDGELILSCPELTWAKFATAHLRRTSVEDAALEDLVLYNCKNVHVAMAQDQLLSLKVLIVEQCYEVGRHLIEELSQMRSLRTLVYESFPAAYMPNNFPYSLREFLLFPLGWCLDLPKGLKDLRNLWVFCFSTKHEFFYNTNQRDIPRPLIELLPLDSLDYLRIGAEVHIRTCRGARLENKWKVSRLGDTYATVHINFPWRDPWYYKPGSCVKLKKHHVCEAG